MRRMIALLAALLAGAASLAQDGVRIGVIDLVSETVPEAQTRVLSNRLRVELVRTGEFTVIERERMDVILEEMEFQMSGCVAVECIVEIGQLLGMEKMIAGNVDRLGDIYMTNLRMVDVETGAIERVAQQDCECRLQDVATISLAQLAAEIAGLGPRLPPHRRDPTPARESQMEARVWPTPTTWRSGPSMPTARYSLAAASIHGKLYVVGGWAMLSVVRASLESRSSRLEVYDTATNRWIGAPPMPTARNGPATGVIDGKLYVVGGSTGSRSGALEIFDPVTNTWSEGPAMPTARWGLAAGVIAGKLYVVGGYTKSSPTGVLEVYDPVTTAWTSGPAMPTPRGDLAASVIDGRLYIAGGSVGWRTDVLEVYDPVANRWQTGPAMPTARYGLASSVIDGKLYAVGGNTGSSPTRALEVYDVATNSWASAPPMPSARWRLAAGVIDGKLYVVGGHTRSSNTNALEILAW